MRLRRHKKHDWFSGHREGLIGQNERGCKILKKSLMLLPSRSLLVATGQALQRSIDGQSEAIVVDLGLNAVAPGSNGPLQSCRGSDSG